MLDESVRNRVIIYISFDVSCRHGASGKAETSSSQPDLDHWQGSTQHEVVLSFIMARATEGMLSRKR